MAPHSVEQTATDPRRFDIELGACQIDQTHSIRSVVSVRTFRERQAGPTCDKTTIEVTMRDNYNISRSLTFLLPFPMIFTNLGTTNLTPPPISIRMDQGTHVADNTVNASGHLFDRFAVGATERKIRFMSIPRDINRPTHPSR